MGVCQSHAEHSDAHSREHAIFFAKEPYNEAKLSATPGAKYNSHAKLAYDLALVSPSEKTGATEALSPSSMFSPASSFPPSNEKPNFHFVSDDDGYPSDEGSTDNVLVSNANVETNDHQIHIEESETVENDQPRVSDHPQMMRHRIYRPSDVPEHDSALVAKGDRIESVRHKDALEIKENCDRNGSNLPLSSPLTEDGGVEGEKDDDDDQGRAFYVSKPDPPPLLAPPKDITVIASSSNTETSVNPATVANFNKMKSQIKEAAKLEKQRRHLEKIEDRRRDIQGYKELWGEYNSIQEQVSHQRDKNPKFLSQSTPKGETISLNDATTWFVDFTALSSDNSCHDRQIDELESGLEDDGNSETNLSNLTESSTLYSHKNLLRHKEAQRRKSINSFSIGSRDGKMTTKSFESYEHGEKERAITMDLNESIMSDLDNGSNSSFLSDIDKAVANDDYGVLSHFTRKSIESSVPTHTETFNAQYGDDDLGDTTTFFCAQTPRKTNKPFAKYLEEHCLPSVTIDDAETGAIRWRTFPSPDEKEKVNRKIDFSDDHKENTKRETIITEDICWESNAEACKGECNLSSPARNIDTGDVTYSLNVKTDDELDPLEINFRKVHKTRPYIGRRIVADAHSLECISSSDALNQKISEEIDDPLKLVRKIGPQLNDLLVQLKDNGLGEHHQ